MNEAVLLHWLSRSTAGAFAASCLLDLKCFFVLQTQYHTVNIVGYTLVTRDQP